VRKVGLKTGIPIYFTFWCDIIWRSTISWCIGFCSLVFCSRRGLLWW